MTSIPLHQLCNHRILGFSDTYGINAGNGVARFLHDLRQLAVANDLPLELVFPARGEWESGLMPVRAPAFSLLGYGELKISMPLRHHRKTIERHIKSNSPDAIHVSTPGPFGCFGITLAQRYRIPLVGIYHTDFPGYARAIIVNQLHKLRQSPQQFLTPVASKVLPLVLPLVGQLSMSNSQVMEDLPVLGEILNRNLCAFLNDSRTDQYLSSVAEMAVMNLLRKFYSRFDLIIARSTEQQASLARLLNLAPNKIRCLRPGTDINRFHPRSKDRAVWCQYGVPQDAFVVLYVGRITAEKNIGFLQALWTEVQATPAKRDMRLVLVGDGEETDLSCLRALKNTHVVGSIHGEALSRIYASADLLVFPSTTETLGQVGLEAGASGLPSIVSDRGGPQMYIQDGKTGWVLPTDNPSVWADQILSLATDPARLSKVGDCARNHIANHFTLNHSLKSYWDLHAEAIVRRNRKSQSPEKVKVKASYLKQLEGKIPDKGVMMISDFHGGRRFGTTKHRDQKRAALKSMLSMAIDRNLEVVFGGDFGDHVARMSRLEKDFESFRNVREELGFKGRPIFIRGNHDYGYTDEQLEQFTGGCRVHDSLVYYQADAKVTISHGHIFGLARTLEVIRTAKSVEQLTDQLQEGLLDEELKPAVIAYDIANMIELGLEKHGLRGLSSLWEGVYTYRAMLAEQFLKLGRNSNEADEATWKMIAGLVGTHDNVEVAAMLGVACGGWASLFGHTHEPLAKLKRVQLYNAAPRHVQVVGNSGHINRKYPTCAVAQFPHVTVYQFESKSNQLRPLWRASLSEPDVDAFVSRIQTRHSNEKAPV